MLGPKLSTSIQASVAKKLAYSPLQLSFHFSHSEEAKVWAIKVEDDLPVAWLKWHSSSSKADKEAQALLSWGCLLNGPKIIARIETAGLLLTHCEGHPVSFLNMEQAKVLGESLGLLHTHPFVDQDPMPIDQALHMREQALLQSLNSTSQRMSKSGEFEYQIYQELVRDLVNGNDRVSGIHQTKRRPCHRDIRSAHLIFFRPQNKTIQLSVIDWGQSRADHWSSDWIRLVLEGHSQETLRYAWAMYWTVRNQREPNQEVHHNDRSFHPKHILRRHITLHILTTLRWADQHLQCETSHNISAKLTIADQVWCRGIDDLLKMNKLNLDE